MSQGVDSLFEDLNRKEDDIRFNALTTLQKMAEDIVPWFEEKVDELIKKLDDTNSFQRSIGIMLLCDLSKSDVNHIIEQSINKILKHINDEKFITSRQCIQNIWKIAVTQESTKLIIEKKLYEHFYTCDSLNHGNLLRQDIISALWNIHKNNGEKKGYTRIIELIESEKDEKNKKKLLLIIK